MNSNKATTSDKSWRLIMVGNHGTIIPLGSTKILLTVLFATLILTVISTSVLGYLYVNQKLDYVNLSKSLESQKEQLQILRDKRDVLMAQLVIAESKLGPKEDSNKNSSSQNEPVSGLENMGMGSPSLPSVSETKTASLSKDSVNEESSDLRVELSDFKINHFPQSNMIKASYSIKNLIPGKGRISGKCVLLLKGKINGETTTYPIPNVPWENGLPSAKLGRPFYIRNFMTLNLERSAPDQSFQFDRGIVYVFENTGNVLLKKEIPLDLSYIDK